MCAPIRDTILCKELLEGWFALRTRQLERLATAMLQQEKGRELQQSRRTLCKYNVSVQIYRDRFEKCIELRMA
jgi:hypothetical protein